MPDPETPPPAESRPDDAADWRRNVRLVAALLLVWFTVSFVLAIVFVEDLNAFRFGGFPLGFWIGQQGAVYVYVVLIGIYAWTMDRWEGPEGSDDSEPPTGGHH